MFQFAQTLYERLYEDKVIARKYLADGIEKALALAASDARAIIDLTPSTDPSTLDKLLTLEMAFREAYMLNSTVATCVNFIADSVSSVPFVLKERKDGIVQDVVDHPAVKLLNDPNSYQDSITFRKVLTQHLLLSGNALMDPQASELEAVRKVTGMKSLELYDPDDFDVVSDNNRSISEYRVKPAVLEKYPKRYRKPVFKADELIHFIDNPDPTHPYWGLGRIQSAYRSIDISSKIQSWWIATMQNGCRKDALLKFKKDLGEVQFKRIKSQVERQLKGIRNGGGVMIIGREHEVEFLNQSPKEMDFSQAEKDSARRIMGIFRVPAPLLSEGEHSEYNMQAEARRAFWLDNVLMLLAFIANVLNKFYLTKFPDLSKRDVWLTYDFSKVDALMRQYLDLIKGAYELWEMGLTRDEINSLLDMGWVKSEGSDESYISQNVIGYKERQQRLKLDIKAHDLEQQKANDANQVAKMQAKAAVKAASQPKVAAPTGAKSKTGQSPANKFRGNQK